MNEAFYIPVNSPQEGKKLLDVLAAYDLFQLQNRIKPDFCNTGGLQMWDEEEQDWKDWYIELDTMYYDDVDEYCESDDCADCRICTKECNNTYRSGNLQNQYELPGPKEITFVMDSLS